MKNSLIWTAAGVAVVGFGIPAYAAITTATPRPTIAPAHEANVESSVATTPSSASVSVESAPAGLPKIGAVVVTDDSTSNSVDDSTSNSVDDSTSNSVEEVSGRCGEAEHANDPTCKSSGAVAPSDDNSTVTSVEVHSSGQGGSGGRHGGGSGGGGGTSDDGTGTTVAGTGYYGAGGDG